MKFKSLKNALDRQEEIERSLVELNTVIETRSAEGKADGVSNEDLTKIVEEVKEKVEERSNLLVELDEVKANIEEIETSRNEQLGLLSELSTERLKEKRDMAKENDIELRSTREYEVAWAKALLDPRADNELRGLISTVGDASAGNLVPTRLVDAINDKMMTGGKFLRRTMIMNYNGVLEVPYIISKTDPTVHVEGATPETTLEKVKKAIETGIVTINFQLIAEIVQFTRKFELSQAGAFFDWLMRELPDALMRKVDNLILNGLADGSEGFRGIKTATAPFASDITSALDFNVVNRAIAKLDDMADEGAIVIMNRATFFDNYLGLTGTDGHPIFTIGTSNLGRPAYFAGGLPVEFDSSYPSYTTATTGQIYASVVNFNGYTSNLPAGTTMTLERDPYTQKNKNIVEYLSEMAGGGAPTKLLHIVNIKKN